MKIPKEIYLFNQTFKVVTDNDYCNGKGVLGEADINHGRIRLCSKYDGEDIPQAMKLHTLFHEIVHCILFLMGQKEVYKDELFVDNLGTAIEDLILQNFNYED